MKAWEIEKGKRVLNRIEYPVQNKGVNDNAVLAAFANTEYRPIVPRETVLTFDGWIGRGRIVRKGEKATRVRQWVPMVVDREGEEEGTVQTERKGGFKSKTCYLFHESQTAELSTKKGRGRFVPEPSPFEKVKRLYDGKPIEGPDTERVPVVRTEPLEIVNTVQEYAQTTAPVISEMEARIKEQYKGWPEPKEAQLDAPGHTAEQVPEWARPVVPVTSALQSVQGASDKPAWAQTLGM